MVQILTAHSFSSLTRSNHILTWSTPSSESKSCVLDTANWFISLLLTVYTIIFSMHQWKVNWQIHVFIVIFSKLRMRLTLLQQYSSTYSMKKIDIESVLCLGIVVDFTSCILDYAMQIATSVHNHSSPSRKYKIWNKLFLKLIPKIITILYSNHKLLLPANLW